MHPKAELIIQDGESYKQYWKDICRYRDLFYFLTLRDFQIRYRQTIVGVFWSVLRPMISMVIFTVLFHKVGNFKSSSMPYPVMVLSGLILWQLFSTIVNDASNSMVSNTSLITKVYFPRLILPASSSLVNLVDFFIGFGIFFVIFLFHGMVPTLHFLLLPLPVLCCVALALGVGFFLSAINVMFRDVKYVVSFLLQLGLYVSPVVFESAALPAYLQSFKAFNPMFGIIDSFRWCISGGTHPLDLGMLISSVLVSVSIFTVGIFFFNKLERKFADII